MSWQILHLSPGWSLPSLTFNVKLTFPIGIVIMFYMEPFLFFFIPKPICPPGQRLSHPPRCSNLEPGCLPLSTFHSLTSDPSKSLVRLPPNYTSNLPISLLPHSLYPRTSHHRPHLVHQMAQELLLSILSLHNPSSCHPSFSELGSPPPSLGAPSSLSLGLLNISSDGPSPVFSD